MYTFFLLHTSRTCILVLTLRVPDLPQTKEAIEAEFSTFYGRFNEKKVDKGEPTKVSTYVESTPAGRYLTRDMKVVILFEPIIHHQFFKFKKK